MPLPVESPGDGIPGLVQACIADPDEGTQCEWQHHIYQDRWLADAGKRHGGTRLVVENRNHLMGSGAEDVLYLEVGDRTPGDEGLYPDDDLRAILARGSWLFVHKDGSPYL